MKTNDQKIRTRFAPSPTGYMHIGGMRTALYCYMFAKKSNGTFVLRIEDTDLERKIDGAEEIIYRSLADAGLHPDEGPQEGGEYGPYIQSQRKDSYWQYALQLVNSGDAYYCFCDKTRLDHLHQQGHTKYDKHCFHLDKETIANNLSQGLPYVIRQNIPIDGISTYEDLVFGTVSVPNADMEDNVLIKSDGMPTYNFANVVDDHLMNINYVIRGTEYLSSTPKYNLLYDALGWQRPHYMHLQPIMRDAQHKLSKRYGDKSYEDYLSYGYLKEAVINYIALLGWSPKEDREKFTLQEMIEKFDISGLSKSSSIFDENKMRWLNGQYIKQLDDQEFANKAKKWLDKCNLPMDLDRLYLSKLLKSRCDTLTDVIQLTQFIQDENFNTFSLGLFKNDKWKTDCPLALQMLPALQKLTTNHFDTLHDSLNDYATQNGYKKGQVLWIFRISITGAESTPGGATEMATLLGKERCINRLAFVQNRMS